MKYNINLVGKKEMSLIDKTLYFFLNYLRYILVITQLVVISVLFYRFRIDQSIIDLKDSLEQKKEIVRVVRPLLNQAEKVNNQMVAIEKVTTDQTAHLASIDYILSIFPQSLFLSKLAVEDRKIMLTGTALDSRHLQLFYARLKKEARFSKVNLSNIKRGAEGYTFDLVLENFKHT